MVFNDMSSSFLPLGRTRSGNGGVFAPLAPFLTLVVLVGIGGPAWTGCGLSDLKSRLHAMDERLATLHHKLDKQQSQIETLSNQLFILEDRVDSNRVALRRNTGKKPPQTTSKSSDEKSAVSPKPTVETSPSTPPRLRVVRLDPKNRARKRHKRIVLRLYGKPARTISPLQGPAIRERIPVAPIPSPGASIPPPGPIQEYRAAFRLYSTGRYAEAVKAFSTFAEKHPDHDYADNAVFWMGQSLYKQKRYRQAAAAFRRVLRRYPSGNKAPDALLKLGLSLKATGARSDAKRILAQVVEIYPNTRVGHIASKVLDTMR